MAQTAVGLFEHPGTADAVVDSLRMNRFPSAGIRIISKPMAAGVESATSTPSVDFAAGLARDLLSMGASEHEAQEYVAGVRRGNVLVFASGTQAQVEESARIMNQYDPLEVAEFAGVAPAAAAARAGEESTPSISKKVDDTRTKTEGARIFSW